MVRCTVHLTLALLFLRACSIIVLLSLLCLWALVCIIHVDDRQILFYDKFQPYYDFTNFAPYPIVVERVIYPTSEHYFQAQKLIGTQHFHQILTNPSPRYAFEYARQEHVKPWIRKDWQEIKNNVMYKALYHKFTQYSTLATMLLQTGDKELIEDSPYDSYWGCGRDKQGMNVLGKLLMKLRKILAAASMEVPHMHVAQIIAFDSHSTESSSVTQAASMGVAQTIDSHSTESSSNVNQAASMGVPCVAQTHSTESSPNVTQKNNVQTETETDHDDNSSSQIMAPSTDANATSESNVQSGDSNSSSQIMAPSTDANATSESNVQSGDGNSSSQIMAPSTDANATPESNVRSGDGNSSSQDTEESNKHVETGNGNSSAVTALHLTDTNATQQVNVQTSDGNPSTEASQARITDNNQNANSQTTFLDLQLLDGMDQGHSGNENVSTTSQDKALCTYQESNTSIPNPDGSEATSPSTYSEENMETNENETSSSDMETN